MARRAKGVGHEQFAWIFDDRLAGGSGRHRRARAAGRCSVPDDLGGRFRRHHGQRRSQGPGDGAHLQRGGGRDRGLAGRRGQLPFDDRRRLPGRHHPPSRGRRLSGLPPPQHDIGRRSAPAPAGNDRPGDVQLCVYRPVRSCRLARRFRPGGRAGLWALENKFAQSGQIGALHIGLRKFQPAPKP